LRRFNHRTHRKLLIIDGQVGFTGGVGIADQWAGLGQDEHHWRETHCRIAGPATGDMHAAFAESWLEATGEALGARPAASSAGTTAVQTVTSTAGRRPTRAELMVASAFGAAERRLWVT